MRTRIAAALPVAVAFLAAGFLLSGRVAAGIRQLQDPAVVIDGVRFTFLGEDDSSGREPGTGGAGGNPDRVTENGCRSPARMALPPEGPDRSVAIVARGGTTWLRIHHRMTAGVAARLAATGAGGAVVPLPATARSPLLALRTEKGEEDLHVFLDRSTGEVLEVALPGR